MPRHPPFPANASLLSRFLATLIVAILVLCVVPFLAMGFVLLIMGYLAAAIARG